jgi:HK97 family phage major capsid protein
LIPPKKNIFQFIYDESEVYFKLRVFSMSEFNKQEILSKPFARSISIETREMSVDDENRTVELSFSSDQPIYHWFGYLILDHSESSVRLDRLNSSGALLWMHDRRSQIGGVSNIRLEDGKGKATAKFSRVGLGAEKFQDVKDEICRTTSFGFFVYDLEPEPGPDGKQRMIDGEPVYRSRDWEPFEVSLEPIPADTGVGVGRNLEANTEFILENKKSDTPSVREIHTEKIMAKENENNLEQPAGEETRKQNKVIQRAAEFVAYGEAFGEVDLARDMALDENNSLEDLGKAILAKRAENQKKIVPPAPEDVARQTQAAVVQSRVTNLKSFRGKDAQINAYRGGMSLLAALRKDEEAIKYCREHGIAYNRTQSGNDNAKGGVFVIPEVENAIIDLRIEYGVARRNCNVTPMSSDTKIIHRRTGGLTAYPVGAGQSGTQSTATWDDIELVARKWMVLAKIEDELNEDSVINFADTLVSEIAYAFTYAEDNCLFNGDGTSTYHGIVGILTKLAGATAGLKTASGNLWSEITRADLLGVVGKLPQFARKSGNVKWYCSHEFWANVLEVIATAAGGVTHAEMHGELVPVFFGKPVEIVEVMPATEANSQIPLLYGNMAQSSTMGDRRGVTVKMTDSNDNDFEKDLESVKGTERFDINNHDLGSTTAAGPLVGLITAGS